MNKEITELLLDGVKDTDKEKSFMDILNLVENSKDTSFGVIPDLLNIINGGSNSE